MQSKRYQRTFGAEKVTISSNDLYPAFDDFVYNMTERIKRLEETPPELHG